MTLKKSLHDQSRFATLRIHLANLVVYLTSIFFIYFVLELVGGSSLRINLYQNFTPLFFVVLTTGFWLSGFGLYVSSYRLPSTFFFYFFHLACALVLLVGVLTSKSWFYNFTVRAGLLIAPVLLWNTLLLRLSEAGEPVNKAKVALRIWYAVNGLLLVGVTLCDWLGVPFINLSYISFVLGSVFNLFWLLWEQRANRHTALLRVQFRTLLFGLAVPGIPIILLTFLPLLVYGKETVSVEYLLPLGLTVPLSFFYSFRRHRLNPAELRFDRTFLIVMLFAVVALIYLQFSYGLAYLGQNLNFHGEVLYISISLLLITVSFAPMRRRIQRLADSLIYGSNYDYQEVLRKLTATFNNLSNNKTMGQTLCSRLTTILDTTGCALLLFDGPDKLEQVSGMGHLALPDPDRNAQVKQLLTADRKTWNSKQLTLNAETICLPVKYHGYVKGGLLIGGKISGNQFSTDDLNLLSIVSDRLGAAIENNRLLEVVYKQVDQLSLANAQAQALNQQLAEVQDQEREELAYLLHDTVLQNIIFMTRHSSFCANLLQSAEPNSAKVIDQLNHLTSVAETSVQELRDICSRLYPLTVDTVGLVAALHWLADKTSNLHGIEVRLELENVVSSERWPHLVERSLFIIANEAINNTLKHAEATCIKILLSRNPKEFLFEVSDNGQGMTETPDIGNLAINGHLGLAGASVRIARLGGKFQIESAPQTGTCIRVSLPLGTLNGEVKTSVQPVVTFPSVSVN